MRPFFPPRPAQPGNNPSPQQAMQFNPNQFPPGFNQPQSRPPPTPHGQNPHYATSQITAFNNFNQPPAIGPQFAQQHPVQNMNQAVAAATLQLLQQQSNPQIPVQMQNNNLAAALVQMAGMLGAQNMPSYQSPLPQQQMFPMMNVNQMPSQQYPQIYPQQQGSASAAQSAMQQNPMGVQNSQPVAPINFPVVAPQPWMNGQWRPPVNHLPDLCHLGSKDSAGKFQGYGRGGPSNMRGRNQTPYARNQRGNMGPSAWNGGQGRQQQGLNRLKDNNEEPKQEFPKFKYTEKEVTEWREARKRNYPNKATGNKRFGRGGKFAGRRRKNQVEDEEKKLRREQLKEVLAKQSELGVEVAEVPPWYLTEPKKPYPKKRQRKDEASTSKGVRKDEASISKGVSKRRRPTLLEKLHEPEIMRDKSRVLQVLKFIALNNFFEQPDEPLKFPVVKLEGEENDDNHREFEDGDEEVAEGADVEDEGKGEVAEGEFEDGDKEVAEGEGKGDVAEGEDVKDEDKKELDKPEEGEITE